MTHPQAMPGLQFLDPAALARIGNLELVARTVVEGFLGGLHRSPHLGTSIDFAEHRQYMPGDDIRALALPVLRHRILLNFHAQSERVTTDQIIAQLLKAVPTPKSGL